MDDDPIPINVYVDELTEEGRVAVRTALDLIAARAGGDEAYRTEIAARVLALIQDINLGVDDALEVSRRLAYLLNAFVGEATALMLRAELEGTRGTDVDLIAILNRDEMALERPDDE
jgi:hypothetical protein